MPPRRTRRQRRRHRPSRMDWVFTPIIPCCRNGCLAMIPSTGKRRSECAATIATDKEMPVKAFAHRTTRLQATAQPRPSDSSKPLISSAPPAPERWLSTACSTTMVPRAYAPAAQTTSVPPPQRHRTSIMAARRKKGSASTTPLRPYPHAQSESETSTTNMGKTVLRTPERIQRPELIICRHRPARRGSPKLLQPRRRLPSRRRRRRKHSPRQHQGRQGCTSLTGHCCRPGRRRRRPTRLRACNRPPPNNTTQSAPRPHGHQIRTRAARIRGPSPSPPPEKPPPPPTSPTQVGMAAPAADPWWRGKEAAPPPS
ncbi:unnamed protein product [Urochloa humidicola]